MNGAVRYIMLAKKAGKLAVGTPAALDAVRRARGGAVYVAADASAATVKRISDKCAFYGAELRRLDIDGAALAHAIGKTGVVAAVYITDAGLSDAAGRSFSAGE